MNHEPFRDQVVIVTGASAGIGRSLALQLAAQGARVAIAARRLDRLEQGGSRVPGMRRGSPCCSDRCQR